MCTECKRKKWISDDKIVSEALNRTGIKDIYQNGAYIWEKYENRAEIIARECAWKYVGISPSSTTYVADLNWTPKDIKLFTDKEILAMVGIGKAVLSKLRNMPENAEEKWQKCYALEYPQWICFAKKHHLKYNKH